MQKYMEHKESKETQIIGAREEKIISKSENQHRHFKCLPWMQTNQNHLHEMISMHDD